MSRTRWAAVIGLLLVIVMVLAALVRARDDGTAAGPGATPSPGSSATLTPSPSALPTTIATSSPTPEPSPSAPAATPPPTPSPTRRPIATGDPRLLYAEFLLRVTDDRAKVTSLNQALGDAAQAGDLPAVRRAAIEILDFTDAEHDWLREHPPAACYADAHTAADAMLSAYAGAADAFIAWADAGSGLAGLAAFGAAVDAATEAGDALTAFGRELEATTCRV